MKKIYGKDPAKGLKPGVKYRDPLQAVPLIADGVEARAGTDDLVQLRRDATPKTGFGRWVARVLRQKYYARIALDEQGTFFWRQINGERTLREICGEVARHYALRDAEGEHVTIQFVKELMTRGLIYLKLPGAAEPEGGKRRVA